MKRGRTLLLVLALLLVVLAVCVWLRARAIEQRAHAHTAIVEAIPETAEPTPRPTPTPEPTPEPTPTPTPYVSPIDFESLRQANADVFAWLEIPGTTVSFPVLQHPTEDEYYLNRNPDGSVGLPGSAFTYSRTAEDFTRFNTVIYAHNMADGSMFGALRDYADMDFLLAHREIIVYTPEAELRYTIFAATLFSDVLINAAYDEMTMADREAFLTDVINYPGALVPGDTAVALEDHILTLSTCVDELPDNRRLVVAKLISVEPEWRSDRY